MPERDESSQPEFTDSAADALFAAAPVPEGALTLEEVGASFPQHEIMRVVGRGGMGMVYLARHRRHDRLEALKILPPRYGDDPEFAARFEREARALARLNHPNIVAVYDAGQTAEGRLYFTMEYVDGQNLAELIRAGAPLDAVALGEQMCAALAYAHGEGIVHRDIKPANVLVDALGRVKIADFGLARMVGAELGATELTSTGVVMGTMGYIAPEQMRGEAVDHRADLFALGAIFYEMLCRDRPAGVFDPPSTRIGCDARWDAIVSRAMQPDLARRFASATEIREALAALRTVATAPRAASPRRAWRTLVLSLAVFALLGGGGFFAWKKRDSLARPLAQPKPAPWVDATSEVQELVLAKQAGTLQDGWLQITKPNVQDFAGRKRMRDVSVRVVFAGDLGIELRKNDGQKLYVVELNHWRMVSLFIWDNVTRTKSDFPPIIAKLGDTFDLMSEHELMAEVRGDRLRAWLDGEQKIEHRDQTIAEGVIALNMSLFERQPEFAPRIKKIEYRVLDE